MYETLVVRVCVRESRESKFRQEEKDKEREMLRGQLGPQCLEIKYIEI